ncbi:MAG: FAD-dependent oxidoreductase [Kiritimatiellae bacterium]|nr:FAD-dependent oxidoreductase [Kiritimatiellia bacterium]
MEYDVLVIGGGHAGYEAALASARMGRRTAMITMEKAAIGRMSCNPSIGGIGKSHIVVEVDALGGEIGRNADYTGIQFRVLNRRKGPAVQATRLQCDKEWFPRRIQAVIGKTANLDIIESTASGLILKDRVRGVLLADGTPVKAKAVVLATGTFLGGKIHVGKTSWEGGRIGENAANSMSATIKDAGFRMGRLKTGTPPDCTGIAWITPKWSCNQARTRHHSFRGKQRGISSDGSMWNNRVARGRRLANCSTWNRVKSATLLRAGRSAWNSVEAMRRIPLRPISAGFPVPQFHSVGAALAG